MIGVDVDWQGWLARWDAQQAFYVPRREERFAVMLDVVEALRGPEPLVLDLASGPGSISARLLDRLPRARAVAVDVDPVLLAMGQGALGEQDGRLYWVEADLRDPRWVSALPVGPYDAVLTTTALHWLRPADLLRVYHDVAGLLAPGGALLNGDRLGFPPSQPAIQRAVDSVRDSRRRGDRTEPWDRWWAELSEEPALAPLLERRRQLDHGAAHGSHAQLATLHEAALAEAGFTEIDTIWADLDDRVLLAVR